MEHIELQGVSIVLIGNFNPAIFNPDWLVAQEIVDADEAAQSQVDIISPEVAQFSIGDFVFEVNTERFALHNTAEPFVRAADVVADLFKDRLAHTPIKALGINYLAHFRVRDFRQQNAFGRALAPLAPWGEWGEELDSAEPEKNGGMVSLTMQQQAPRGRKAGNVRITVQPSNRLQPLGTGVFVQVNDHYDQPDGGSDNMVDLCADVITPSLERSRRIVGSLSDHARSL